jgi:hypothetical protein
LKLEQAMRASPDELRDKLRAAFAGYKFKDERCGMCRSDVAANLLVKRLAKKPLLEFTAEDTLSYCRLLQCQPDTGAKFILPRLLELKTPEAEQLVHEKYRRLRLHFTAQEQFAVDACSEHAWHVALGSRELETILTQLALIKVLSGRIEPFLMEWLGGTPPLHPALVELSVSFWTTALPEPLERPDIRDWLFTDVLRSFEAAAERSPLAGRAAEALGLLRAYSGR